MTSILVRLGSHWCSRLGETVVVEESWCYICGHPDEAGQLVCIDCGEKFPLGEMDSGDPYREGFCKWCADSAREQERHRV